MKDTLKLVNIFFCMLAKHSPPKRVSPDRAVISNDPVRYMS